MTQVPIPEIPAALAEDAHARLSPSGSKKWFACAGSITLEAPIPNKSNKYSDDGTACHTVAAWCLVEHWRASKRIGDYITVSVGDEPVRKVLFTEDMADMVQQYVDAVRYQGIGSQGLWVEQRVEFSEWVNVPNQFGTADAVILRADESVQPFGDSGNLELQVHDAKFGRMPVEVEDNSQLMLYALGVISSLINGTLTNEVSPVHPDEKILDNSQSDAAVESDEDALY